MSKTSKQLVNELMQANKDAAFRAKEKGEPVAWSTAWAPQELLETLDIRAVCTENFSALLGARKQAQPFIDYAENIGYSIDICSYAKINLGYAAVREGGAENIPMPDFLFCCSNICHTAIKWYENLAAELHVPMILFDAPFSQSYEISAGSIEYMDRQFKEAVKRLERISGRKFSYERLQQVMRISSEVGRLWQKAVRLAAARPAPITGFDLYNYFGVMVAMRGQAAVIDLLKLWINELQDKIRRKEGGLKESEEKYRVLWDGLVCWPYLRSLADILAKNGINMVVSTSPNSFPILYDPADRNSMIKAYGANFVNRSLDFMVDNLSGMVKEYSIDGIIYHSNRSCKLMDFRQYEIQRRVQARTRVPSVIIDGDQTDTRSFSLAQYETRVQALMEMMENARP